MRKVDVRSEAHVIGIPDRDRRDLNQSSLLFSVTVENSIEGQLDLLSKLIVNTTYQTRKAQVLNTDVIRMRGCKEFIVK